jgi:phage baseplate assembly protein gpV
MDPVAIVNAAILALNSILKIIGTIHVQGGMTADQIIAQAQTQTDANSAAVTAIKQHLGVS